ncbi:MAG: acetolactate synthase small subunit [Clostridia bacterium]|nr:acetolactate synthase small subunit [Clostridia bacterium]
MRNQLLSVLVTNHFGVLMRVTNLFSRRGYNIKALTVGETENPEFSRITILTEGDENRIGQIMKQLEKLEDVHRVLRLEDGCHVARELLLLKVTGETGMLDAFAALAVAAGAKPASREGDSLILEFTGTSAQVDGLIEAARASGLAEICRTGATGMQTGRATLTTL